MTGQRAGTAIKEKGKVRSEKGKIRRGRDGYKVRRKRMFLR